MNVQAILNTIRANASTLYQDRVPVATQENLAEIGTAIIDYQNTRNEFCDALVNRIAFTRVSNRRFKNPLATLKKGQKPFGTDIEDIYVNPTKASKFDGESTELLNVKKPDIKTIFYRMNRQDKYKVSITIPMLKKAFTSFGEMEKLITGVINAMYTGDEMDELLLMKNTISTAIANGSIKSYEITYDGGAETSKELIKLVKTLSSDFASEPSNDFNGYNELNKDAIESGTITPCTTWTPTENQVLLIRSDVDASTDVEVLAKAFNMDKTEFLKRKFVVKSLGDADTLALICDESLFQFYDDLYQSESFNNGENLTQSYYLHHWQTLSLSLYANAIAIKQLATETTAETEPAKE